jgi:Bacterial Ig domain
MALISFISLYANFALAQQQALSGSNTRAANQTPPTVSITSPSAANYSGSLVFTGTCTDAIGCISVSWQVDGYTVSSANTSTPYTFNWPSNTFIDGPHTVTMIATNVGSAEGTASVAITTSNGVAATTYFLDPTAGSDNNSCASTGTACQTPARMNSLTFHGGDSILIRSGSTLPITTATFWLLGPNTGLGTQNVYPGGANAPITISTYGGGTCNVMPGGTTTGCATLAMQMSSALKDGMVLGNLSNVQVSNLIVTGGTAAVLGSALAGNGIKIRNNSGVNSGVLISNVMVLDFAADVLVYNPGSPGTGIAATVENSYVGGSSNSVNVDVGVWGELPGTNLTVSGVYATNVNGRAGSSVGSYNGCCGNGLFLSNGATGVIEFSVVNGFNSLVDTCGGGAGIWSYSTKNVIFKFNEVYGGSVASRGCDGHGFDLDAGTVNGLVEYNYSHNNVGAGFLHYNAPTGQDWVRNTTRYNISENDKTSCVSVAFTQNGSESYIYNNTCFSDSTLFAGSCLNTLGNPDVVFVNNLCYHMSVAPWLVYAPNNPPPSNMLLDYNLYYAGGGNARFQWGVAGTYGTFPEFQVATSKEVHGVYANPLIAGSPPVATCFRSGTPAGPQPCPSVYDLTVDSPAVGVGLDLTRPPYSQNIGSQDYYGNSIPNGVGTGYNIGADGAHH